MSFTRSLLFSVVTSAALSTATLAMADGYPDNPPSHGEDVTQPDDGTGHGDSSTDPGCGGEGHGDIDNPSYGHGDGFDPDAATDGGHIDNPSYGGNGGGYDPDAI